MKFSIEEQDEHQSSLETPRWLVSYADMVTLLLAFFVALVSFANTDLEAFRDMLASMHHAFGAEKKSSGQLDKRGADDKDLDGTQRVPLTSHEQGALRSVKSFVLQRKLDREVEVVTTDEGVVVRLKDRLLFDVGSDGLSPNILPVLDKLAEFARAFPEGVSVEGHTDNVPIHTERFPSNWELSAARATAVLRYLQRERPLPSKNIQVVGFADNAPLAPNTTDENRARNRRVEFVFKRKPQREETP